MSKKKKKDSESKTERRIDALIKKGKIKKALELTINAIKQFPEMSAFYISHSLANSEMGNYEEALKILKQAEELFKNDHDVFFHLAGVYEELKEPQKAAEYFQKSFDYAPTPESRSECLNNLGILSYNSGRREEAMEYWRKSLETYPDAKIARFNLRQMEAVRSDIIVKTENSIEEKDSFDFVESKFQLFTEIQKNKYLKERSFKEFSSKAEEEKVLSHIQVEWFNNIFFLIPKMESFPEDHILEWFNYTNIDFEKPVPDVTMPAADYPGLVEFNKKLTFLPPNALSFLMVVIPALEAAGISLGDMKDLSPAYTISPRDKKTITWAYEIGRKFFAAVSANSPEERMDRMLEAQKIMSERLSSSRSEKILMEIIATTLGPLSEEDEDSAG